MHQHPPCDKMLRGLCLSSLYYVDVRDKVTLRLKLHLIVLKKRLEFALNI